MNVIRKNLQFVNETLAVMDKKVALQEADLLQDAGNEIEKPDKFFSGLHMTLTTQNRYLRNRSFTMFQPLHGSIIAAISKIQHHCQRFGVEQEPEIYDGSRSRRFLELASVRSQSLFHQHEHMIQVVHLHLQVVCSKMVTVSFIIMWRNTM